MKIQWSRWDSNPGTLDYETVAHAGAKSHAHHDLAPAPVPENGPETGGCSRILSHPVAAVVTESVTTSGLRAIPGWGIALLACALLAGCGDPPPRTQAPAAEPPRVIAPWEALRSYGDLLAVEDTLRGVTCYLIYEEAPACVKTREARP